MKSWILSSLDEETIKGEETNQRRKLYEEILYVSCTVSRPLVWIQTIGKQIFSDRNSGQIQVRLLITDGPGKIEKFLGDDDVILNSLSRVNKIIYILLQGVWIMRELSKSDIVGNSDIR